MSAYLSAFEVCRKDKQTLKNLRVHMYLQLFGITGVALLINHIPVFSTLPVTPKLQ